MKKMIIAALAMAAAGMASAQTITNLVVEENDGTINSYPISEIQGVLFQDMPDYTAANYLLRATYSEAAGLGNYQIEFGTGEADASGDPLNVGDMQIALNLSADKTADITSPVLPTGYYRAGNGTAPMSFNVARCAVYQRIEEGENGVAPNMILSGTVDVRCDGDIYDIRMEVVTLGGEINMRYIGKLPFAQGVGESMNFEEDQEVTFAGAQGRFYGNWFYPFADDCRMEFYKGTIENNTWKHGYWLTLDLNMPKVADPMAADQKVADGTYVVEWNPDVKSSQYLPYTFVLGRNIDFMGTMYLSGSNLIYTTETGQRYEALLVGGTMTVSNNGTHFEFDFEAHNGIHVRGSFDGTPAMQNFCDNDAEGNPKPPYSTLTEDHTLTWQPTTLAYSYYDETNQIRNDLKNVDLYLSVPSTDKGDYLQFTVFSATQALQDGTYTVAGTLEENTIIPGFIGAARTPVYSWYGDLSSSDDEGYQTTLAPIAEGTVTISTLENGERKLAFDLKDDRGHAITGEYTAAELYDLTDAYNNQEAPARRQLRGRK